MSGSRHCLNKAKPLARTIKIVIVTMVEVIWIPQVVKFRININSGTIATDRPKLRASLSIRSREMFRGYSAEMKVKPGKNNTNGNPIIIRRTLLGKNAIMTKSRAVSKIIAYMR